jgi:predicted enzyme related to lactoylglutathione lyase
MSGRVVHFEIPFDDGDRARSFYADAFGWQVQPMPELDYTLVMSGPSGDRGPTEPGYINGGMVARSNAPASAPTFAIDVASIDDALTKVAELGGTTVVPKTAVGPMGWTAYFRDPEGNVIGLWETAPQG